MGRAFEFRKSRKIKRWSSMAKIFTKIVKEITICAKEGGTDPKTNSKLRALIQNAKNANMPKENIQRALQKANEIGLTTIGLTGISGGEMNNICDFIIKVPSDDTPRIQEAHILLGHILCQLIEEEMYNILLGGGFPVFGAIE